MSLYGWNVNQAKPGTALSDLGPNTVNQANWGLCGRGNPHQRHASEWNRRISWTGKGDGIGRAMMAALSSSTSVTHYRGDFNMTAPPSGATETSVMGEFSESDSKSRPRRANALPYRAASRSIHRVTGNQLSVSNLQGAGPLSGYENIDVPGGILRSGGGGGRRSLRRRKPLG